jgi:hypothetical protein
MFRYVQHAMLSILRSRVEIEDLENLESMGGTSSN